jgi:ribosomal protein S18 acetylase RimI-like enzyme
MNQEIKIITNKIVDEKFIKNLHDAFPVAEDNPNWNLQAVKEFVQNNHNKFLAGYVDNQVAAYLYGCISDRLDNKRKKFYVHGLSTKKEFQRQGVMTAIINYLIDVLKQEGLAAIWLLTEPDNIAAVNLYNKTIGNPKDQIMFTRDF